MGSVVNLGTNDQYFIFRGSLAKEFLGGMRHVLRQPVVVAFPNKRVERGEILVTDAHTFCLYLNCEDIGDALLELVFDITVENFIKGRIGKNGHRTG